MKNPQSLIALGAIILAAASARADVRYTTQMTMGNAPANPEAAKFMPVMRTTTFLKDNNERQEMSIQSPMFQSNTVTLTLCAQRQVIKMDPALKLYTVSPMGAQSFAPPAAAPNRHGKTSEAATPGDGHVITTFTVQNLGSEKLHDLDTRHALLTIHTQSSGCAGDQDTTMKMEIWTAPVKVQRCPDRYQPSTTVTSDTGCKVTYEIKGDLAGMRDAYNGMIVQAKYYQDAKATTPFMTQDLREYSLAALDNALFTVPADFKKVSEADFTNAQGAAMRDRMMRGMGNPDQGNSAAAPDKDQKPNTDAAPAPSGDNTDQSSDEKKDEGGKKKKFKLPKLPF